MLEKTIEEVFRISYEVFIKDFPLKESPVTRVLDLRYYTESKKDAMKYAKQAKATYPSAIVRVMMIEVLKEL